jgi:hypothetical protein
MRKEIKKYLPEISASHLNRENPCLLRVILSEKQTQLDFGYAATDIYIKGGWIRISPDTFLQIKGSEKRYKLTDAVNITIAPNLVEFESKADWCVFSLYFEPIPIKDCIIDMIEEENPTPNDFNFYNIQLHNVIGIALRDGVE